jgi:hypothetical protein
MSAMTVNAWACHVLASLWVIGLTGIFITAILTWKILDDCKRREARRKRQRELYNGRPDISTSTPC